LYITTLPPPPPPASLPSSPPPSTSFSVLSLPSFLLFFFFNDTATTEIYTLSLHDALPILARAIAASPQSAHLYITRGLLRLQDRSEEHTSELQSLTNLVCRLLLEKKKKKKRKINSNQQKTICIHPDVSTQNNNKLTALTSQ